MPLNLTLCIINPPLSTLKTHTQIWQEDVLSAYAPEYQNSQILCNKGETECDTIRESVLMDAHVQQWKDYLDRKSIKKHECEMYFRLNGSNSHIETFTNNNLMGSLLKYTGNILQGIRSKANTGKFRGIKDILSPFWKSQWNEIEDNISDWVQREKSGICFYCSETCFSRGV